MYWDEEYVKKMCSAHVLYCWFKSLREQAAKLISPRYLRVDFLGLTQVHSMFRLGPPTGWETQKLTIQARLLSERFKLEALSYLSFCVLQTTFFVGRQHLVTVGTFRYFWPCPSLSSVRNAFMELCLNFIYRFHPRLMMLVSVCLHDNFHQFWLDCSIIPKIIFKVQRSSEEVLAILFQSRRNFWYTFHKERIRFRTC